MASVLPVARTVPASAVRTFVPIEARKYIPVPIDEVTLDWMIVPQAERKASPQGHAHKDNQETLPGTDVLLVAIQNSILNTYQDIVQTAQLNASFFELEIFSTIRTILEENTEPVVIFDFGASSTKLYLVERGAIRGSHTVNRGSQDVTQAVATNFGVTFKEAEQIKRGHGKKSPQTESKLRDVVSVSLNYIFNDTNRFIKNYETKYGGKVSRAYLVGGGSTLVGFKEMAQEGLDVEAVLGNAFGKIGTPAFLEDVLRKTGPEFTAAVGVALRKLQ